MRRATGVTPPAESSPVAGRAAETARPAMRHKHGDERRPTKG